MIRVLVAATLLAVAASAVVAQSNPTQERNALMSSMWRDGWRPITNIVRGREPYDQAKVDAGFAKINELAGKLPLLWPEGSQGVAPNASFTSTSKVWEDKAGFEAKLAAFTKAAAQYKEKGKVKNLDELKVAFEAVNDACNSCHETYRARVPR